MDYSVIFVGPQEYSQRNEPLFAFKRPKPHTCLSQIKLIQITNSSQNDLIFNNLSSCLFTNSRYKENILKQAEIKIEKPNEGVIPPTKKLKPTSPKRIRKYERASKYQVLKTVDSNWSKEELEQFIKLRFS